MKPDDISSIFICIIYPEEDEAQRNVTIEIFPPAHLMICTLMFLSVKYKGPMGYDRAWLANGNGNFHVNFRNWPQTSSVIFSEEWKNKDQAEF